MNVEWHLTDVVFHRINKGYRPRRLLPSHLKIPEGQFAGGVRWPSLLRRRWGIHDRHLPVKKFHCYGKSRGESVSHKFRSFVVVDKPIRMGMRIARIKLTSVLPKSCPTAYVFQDHIERGLCTLLLSISQKSDLICDIWKYGMLLYDDEDRPLGRTDHEYRPDFFQSELLVSDRQYIIN